MDIHILFQLLELNGIQSKYNFYFINPIIQAFIITMLIFRSFYLYNFYFLILFRLISNRLNGQCIIISQFLWEILYHYNKNIFNFMDKIYKEYLYIFKRVIVIYESYRQVNFIHIFYILHKDRIVVPAYFQYF